MRFDKIISTLITHKPLLTVFCYASVRGKKGFNIKNLSSSFYWGADDEPKLYTKLLLNLKVISKKGPKLVINELGQCAMLEIDSFKKS